MSFYKNKNILVTGGTGLIGIPLVEMLINENAKVTVASLDNSDRVPLGAVFKRLDLRDFSNCMEACAKMDIVFHLAGVKGSPLAVKKRPASFFVPTITFNTNMMEAARRCDVECYLYTSSIGVYSPAEIFKEDDVDDSMPSRNDRFAGWAKRMGELQAQAYSIEYGWNNISIVRPANVYGPYDNFETDQAMVIPALIKRALNDGSPLSVWGDGSTIRDFIHAKDVARGMMFVVEKGVTEPVNLGSGTGVSIRSIVDIITNNIPNGPIEVEWNLDKPMGDKKRILDTSRACSYGFKPKITIEEGIKETISWHLMNKRKKYDRYEVFLDEQLSQRHILR